VSLLAVPLIARVLPRGSAQNARSVVTHPASVVTHPASVQVRVDLSDLDAVVTFCELAVPLVARLAERLGLPSNSVEAVDTARNKYAARAAMSKAKLPTPLNYLIEHADQLDAAAKHVGFPAVIKPTSGAASIGVVRVNDLDELRRNYKTCAAWTYVRVAGFKVVYMLLLVSAAPQVCAVQTTHSLGAVQCRVIGNLSGARVVAGALVEGTGEEDAEPGNAGGWMDLSIMMEEYLDGEARAPKGQSAQQESIVHS
jgi:ATP-grasp N-terminal domain